MGVKDASVMIEKFAVARYTCVREFLDLNPLVTL